MNKKVLYGKEARQAILQGVQAIAKAVKVTLGPMGRNVLISESVIHDYATKSLPLHVTKDGYTVTKAFESPDDILKPGVQIVKESAQKSVDQSGDGTTTTVVLLEAIVEAGVEAINNGSNPVELKKGIDAAVKFFVEKLAEKSIPLKGDIERIRQIATISANNDSEIGDVVANAFSKIGSEGIIDLVPGRGTETETKIAEGYKWENGWISPYFINKPEKQICEFQNPLILLYEKRINHHTQIENACAIASSSKRPLLIVCEDLVDEGLGVLAANVIQNRIAACVVKAPAFGEERRIQMEDLAIITGGVFMTDTKGESIKEVKNAHFGRAEKVIVTREETVIIGGDTAQTKYDTLLDELYKRIQEAPNEDERHPLEKRVARLKGGVAVVTVGAHTETEMKERLDRFDDAVRAVKSAVSEGFAPGAGSAFNLIVKSDLTPILLESNLNVSFIRGYQIVIHAVSQVLLQICENAGVEYSTVYKDVFASNLEYAGYNAKTGNVENLVESGIIDPVKVLRCALQNAASSAGTILTCESIIVDHLN